MFGNNPNPFTSSLFLPIFILIFGTQVVNAIAPALQPANEAPFCHSLTIAFQTRESLKVSAK